MQAANNYQQKGANSQYKGKKSNRFFDPSSPTVGQFIFFIGLFVGFPSLPFIFHEHCWLTPIGLLTGGLLIIAGFYLTAADRRAEDIRIVAVIVAELKLRNVERQIFAADLWKLPTMPRLRCDQKPSIVLV